MVSGRRRQGKSYLLQALASVAGGIYFPALEVTETVALRLFADELIRFTGAPIRPFRDWLEAIPALFRAVSDRPVPVPRAVMSLGEAKWDEIMGLRHLDRLKRARDLLAVKGYDTSRTILACYSGNGFTDDLKTAASQDAGIRLIGLDRLYAPNS